jgi:hypothetical protein
MRVVKMMLARLAGFMWGVGVGLSLANGRPEMAAVLTAGMISCSIYHMLKMNADE